MLPVAPMNSILSEGPAADVMPRHIREGVTRAMRLALLFLTFNLLLAVPAIAAEHNLLLNGDLSAGSAEAPRHWIPTPLTPPESFKWWHSAGEPPRLEIAAPERPSQRAPYWTQTLNLARGGWYELSFAAKTDHPATRAAIAIAGAHATGSATVSSTSWSQFEVYFKIAGPELVQIGCGVRGLRGRASFRHLTLTFFSGLPPRGSRQLDITPAYDPPRSEVMALHGLKVAKSAPNESLLRDVLNFRVIAAVLFLFAALAYLDWRYRTRASGDEAPDRFFRDPELKKSAGIAAFLCLTLLGTWLVTRIEYLPGHGFFVVERHAVGGDAPHYMVMINSLLLKHNLQLRTVYDDVDRGGIEAGLMARGTELDRHTVFVNRRTGHRTLGVAWYNAGPEFAPSPDVYEIPVHPAGFPLLMALAVAPMQPRAREVEPDVGLVLMLIAWLGIVITYFVGRQVGMGRKWSVLAASLLFAASPWLAYSRAYFAESTIGLMLILGLWALMSDLPVLAALAAGIGAIMKPPFALVGVGFLFEEVREKRWKDALKIAVVLGLPALEILGYNFWLHRSPLELSLTLSFQFTQLVDTLVGSIEGLFVYAPWTIFGFFACAYAFVSPSAG